VATWVSVTHAQEYSPYFYDIGLPSLTELYVDPTSGDDNNAGTSRSAPVKTVQAAWALIPSGQILSTGFRINMLPGTYTIDNLVNFYEDRQGTAQRPIIISAADGQGTVTWSFGINMKNCSYVYFINFSIITPGADPLHVELGNHILIRGMTLDGGSSSIDASGNIASGANVAHEGIKINQSQYVYIENTNIAGADDNAIDFVAVQYGHVVASKIHHSGDWCMYAKGGSAYLRIEGNELRNCGTGGFTAGQGTGFEFMVSPWIHYEAYDIKFLNNVIHHIAGAAVGVNGGYNVLIAHNTAYETGSRDHVIEAGAFGQRSCDGDAEKVSNCGTYNSAGGWGPTTVTTGSNDVTPGAADPQPIPNRNVYIYNNIFYNASISSPQHFAVYGPRSPATETNINSPAKSDDNLVIKGNIIWNGNNSTPLGIEDDTRGCQNSNATCNSAQLSADNLINSFEPALTDPNNNDFRPAQNSNVLTASSAALVAFAGGDRESTPQAPEGNLNNQVDFDRGGAPRQSFIPPGAYVSSSSSIEHESAPGSPLPSDPPGNSSRAPDITSIQAFCSRKQCTVQVVVTGSVTRVTATVQGGGVKVNVALKGQRGSYSGKASFSQVKKKTRLTIKATAKGSLGKDSGQVKVTALR